MAVERALSPRDGAILNLIQLAFPISADPYGDIAATVAGSREQVHAAVQSLREQGIIRRIGGSFAAKELGYVSVLVAAKVETEHLDAVAAVVSSFSEVTHNYERLGTYNLWFTVIAETPDRMNVILDQVRQCGGVKGVYPLPALQTFKIKVDFKFAGDSEVDSQPTPGAPASSRALTKPSFDEYDRQIIPRLCGDLGDGLYPFQAIAAEIGFPLDDLLQRISWYQEQGMLRRFGAILRHQSAGFTANGMSVWNVPDERVAEVAELMTDCPEISHCYERPRLPDWPYNLFGMIHAKSEDEVRAIAGRLAEKAQIPDYDILFSIREFKKSSMVYLA